MDAASTMSASLSMLPWLKLLLPFLLGKFSLALLLFVTNLDGRAAGAEEKDEE